MSQLRLTLAVVAVGALAGLAGATPDRPWWFENEPWNGTTAHFMMGSTSVPSRIGRLKHPITPARFTRMTAFTWDGGAANTDWDAMTPAGGGLFTTNWGETAAAPSIPGASDDVRFVSDAVVTGNGACANFTNLAELDLGAVVRINGPDFMNSGTIGAPAPGGVGSLQFQQNSTLMGGGTIQLRGNLGIFARTATVRNTDQMIRGSGEILVGHLQNEGSIIADRLLRELVIENAATRPSDPPSTMTNTGVLGADLGGTLTIEAQLDNTGGHIEVGVGSTVEFARDSLIDVVHTGGTLAVRADGLLRGSGGTLRNMAFTFDSGSMVQSGSFEDSVFDGTMTLGGPLDDPAVHLFGRVENRGSMTGSRRVFDESTLSFWDAELSGGGSIDLNSTDVSAVRVRGSFTNVDNIIRGGGFIDADMVNKHLIVADSTERSLAITGAIINEGSIIARAGSALSFGDDTVTNDTGRIIIESGADFSFRFGGIRGGVLELGDGVVIGEARGVLANVSLQGDLLLGGGNIELGGVIVNPSLIGFEGDSVPDHAGYRLESGGATLTGGGRFRLATGSASRTAIRSNDTMTNLDNLIHGAGLFSADLVNHATVRADIAGSAIEFRQGTADTDRIDITNHGTIEAVSGTIRFGTSATPQDLTRLRGDGDLFARNGGTIVFENSSDVAVGGAIHITEGSSLIIDDVSIEAGMLEIDGSSVASVLRSSVLTATTVDQNGVLELLGPVQFTIDGDLVQSESSVTYLAAERSESEPRHAEIVSTGAAFLTGVLDFDVQLEDLKMGAQFDVIDAARGLTLGSDFRLAQNEWLTHNVIDGRVLRLTSIVPAPGTATVLTAVGVTLAPRRRKTNRARRCPYVR